MKHSIFSLGLAFSLSVGLAGAALADQTTTGSSPVRAQLAAVPSDNLTRQQAIESDAVKAYNAGVNPLASYRSSGPYDQGDAFTGPNGFAVPGYRLYKDDPTSFGN